MPEHTLPTPRRAQDDRRLRRLRLGLLAGLTLILLGTPAVVVVALVTEADWAFVVALLTFMVGLFTMGGIIAPGRSSFHACTKIWQNDGRPA